MTGSWLKLKLFHFSQDLTPDQISHSSPIQLESTARSEGSINKNKSH